jgi:hypothetical protein
MSTLIGMSPISTQESYQEFSNRLSSEYKAWCDSPINKARAKIIAAKHKAWEQEMLSHKGK